MLNKTLCINVPIGAWHTLELIHPFVKCFEDLLCNILMEDERDKSLYNEKREIPNKYIYYMLNSNCYAEKHVACITAK